MTPNAVASSASRSQRRALGFSSSRGSKPGTATLVAGMVLVAVGAFIGGRSLSGDDTGDRVTAIERAADPVTDSHQPSAAARSSDAAAPTPADAELPTAVAVAIPDGHEGVAVTLPFTAAGGGYVAAGDQVNVHGIDPTGAQAATVVLDRVSVLDVSIEVAPRVVTGTAERAAAGNITYLLAVPVERVSELVDATHTRSLYLSLWARAGGNPESGAR